MTTETKEAAPKPEIDPTMLAQAEAMIYYDGFAKAQEFAGALLAAIDAAKEKADAVAKAKEDAAKAEQPKPEPEPIPEPEPNDEPEGKHKHHHA